MILGIYGSGGLGRDVYSLAEQINVESNCWESIVFIDDVTEEKSVRGISICNFESFQRQFSDKMVEIIIAVGEPLIREQLFMRVKQAGFKMAKLIHPNVYIPEDTVIEDGCLIYNMAFISSNAYIKNNSIVMAMAAVGHGCIVGANSVICTGALLGGECQVGKNSFLAMASAVRERVLIGDMAVLGLGAIVFKDVPDGSIVLGNPARVIAKNDGVVFKDK